MWLGGTTVPQNNPEITRNNVHLTVVIMYDKTFNLGPLHLTVTVFKQHSVTRMATNDNPIFFGPMCLHGNSNRSMWTAFFQHLATALDGCEKFLVFGTDNESEPSLRQSMQRSRTAIWGVICCMLLVIISSCDN